MHTYSALPYDETTLANYITVKPQMPRRSKPTALDSVSAMACYAQVLHGQLNQVNATAPATKALQGHSLQQVPAPKIGSSAGAVHILAVAATALSAAPHSAAGLSQVQHICTLYSSALACYDTQ